MKTSLLNMADDLKGGTIYPLATTVTFRSFVHFLEERIKSEKTIKSKFYQFVHEQIMLLTKNCTGFSTNTLYSHEPLLELVYSVLSNNIDGEENSLWGLSAPLSPVIFYSTDLLFNLMFDKRNSCVKDSIVKRKKSIDIRNKLEIIYSFILEKLYGFTFVAKDDFVYALNDENAALIKYYKVNLDNRFVSVKPTGPLPELDFRKLEPHFQTDKSYEFLATKLPLSMFEFEGFSVINLTDITPQYSVETIKNLILNKNTFSESEYFENVVRSLKNLTGFSDIEFGLLPVLKINNRLVFTQDNFAQSILSEDSTHPGVTESVYLSMAEKYFTDPKIYFYKSITGESETSHLKLLKEKGVASYALIPVFYNNHLAGVLEAHSKKENIITDQMFVTLEPVLPLLAQVLQNNIDEFQTKISNIIKDKFTSLQPAVQWKFNEVAWHYLQNKIMHKKNKGIETIIFKNVYPLYGAVDVRNSTVERNNALRKDLQIQFGVLLQTLNTIQLEVKLGLLDEVLFKTRKLQDSFEDIANPDNELNVDDFLEFEINPLLDHFKTLSPQISEAIKTYYDSTDGSTGVAFLNRRQLEKSMQTINTAVNQYLEIFGSELQQSYPCYFEKFRTDGVEYDIYIGQSIVPEKTFDLLYLRNLRLWQLKSMAAIAQITHSLLPQLFPALDTTQLIFAHSSTIDISFRNDEKRFDAEGAYNIRYHIIKKRIDKIHVKQTRERLTQPGKIAVIFFNHKEGDEYSKYIHYLQEQQVLEYDLEELDLEDLQGVKGLKALRVGIKFTATSPMAIEAAAAAM